MSTVVANLNATLQEIKNSFVGKNEIIDLLGIGLLARENVFLYGPPGTAKSALVRALVRHIQDGKNFEYLLTRFTEPNEIFGPFDIRKLKEGDLVTNTEGMLPEASLIFLDEIFNANSAILNSLLMALNEKIFRRGKETRKLPALMFVSASNILPEDDALNALLDRFLIRVKCENVAPEQLNQVLLAGRKLDQVADTPVTTTITSDEIRSLQARCKQIDLSAISKTFIDLILSIRNTGIRISDRRAVKLQSLIAASALMCNRDVAILSDLWVLKYIWDTEEQMEVLEGLVNTVIEKDTANDAHPQAFYNKAPNAEALMQEVQLLTEKYKEEGLSMEEKNIVKDKLRYVQSRCEWIQQPEQKNYIQKEIDALWQLILQTV
jgi:MoxR-like ATPase